MEGTHDRMMKRQAAGGCYVCRHYRGAFNAEALVCEIPGHRHCPSLPKSGCAFWEREPASDDADL